jgi:flagellar basal body-associated protein FliL
MSDETDADLQITPPKGGKMVPLLLGVNSLVLIAVLGVVLTRSSGNNHKASEDAAPAAEAAEVNKAGPTLKLADFTARLHGVDTDRYARLSIEIEVPTEKDRDELNGHMAQIRDSFIGFLADCNLEDLSGSAAIAKTKEKLIARLHDVVPTQRIRGLYITDLVIQ